MIFTPQILLVIKLDEIYSYVARSKHDGNKRSTPGVFFMYYELRKGNILEIQTLIRKVKPKRIYEKKH
jgi:hypothetical protein